jgi:uncharacterized membrane protein
LPKACQLIPSYLLVHGLVKVVLVLAVIKNTLWAYPAMIGFLVIFIFYQIGQMIYHFSLGLLILTILDILIILLAKPSAIKPV